MARYSATDVARYMVNLCIEEKSPVSNLQVQKILYFCQQEYYVKTGTPLFDDDFQAWQYGPVIPEVYKVFSLFGGMKISRRVGETAVIDGGTRAIIGPVIRDKRGKYPWDLVEITHQPGSPWDIVFAGGAGTGCVIDKSLIFGNL